MNYYIVQVYQALVGEQPPQGLMHEPLSGQSISESERQRLEFV